MNVDSCADLGPLVVCVDPGTEISGLAMFYDKRLHYLDALKVKGPDIHQRCVEMIRRVYEVCGLLRREDTLVIEYPQVYTRGPGAKGDPDDVLALVLVAGGVLATLNRFGQVPFKLVRPREWKGTAPKRVMTARIFDRLDADEQKLALAVKKDHNALDAAGLGLWHLGRL